MRLLNALKSEDRGLKVRFSLAMIVFETFELILCQMLSSQGKNAPSNPYPHFLVHVATSRKWGVRSVVVEFGIFGAPDFQSKGPQIPIFKGFWGLWTENRGAPKAPNSTTTDLTPHLRPSALRVE